jgi:hypothetical protein
MSLNNVIDGGSVNSGTGLFTPGDNALVTNNSTVAPSGALDPSKYSTIGTLVGEYAKPDVREQLIQTYGDQGITGFLKLTGAINAAATQDEVTYFEEARRHKKHAYTGTVVANSSSSGGNDSVTLTGVTDLQKNDVVLDTRSGVVGVVLSGGISSTGAAATSVVVGRLDGATADITATGFLNSAGEVIHIGNLYGQGTEQPFAYQEPGLVKRINPFMIIKDRFEVTGSAATNIGYVNLGNGDYRWYMKGEQDTRARFEDRREMMMLFATNMDADGTDKVEIQSVAGMDGVNGSEGYFAAIADRGITKSGLSTSPFSAMSDIDDIIKELDKEGAPAEYAMYLNRAQDLAIDDLLANGIATQVTAGLSGQFGAFNNSADMAVQLGFKSFTRGGYTFHKHDWKLLNDPTLMGASSVYQGAMVPMTQVVDPKSGIKSPALEMNYKAANGYSREMEHWVTGGGVLGFNNNGDTGKDSATFHYRSEINLITRAANQHVALKG